MITLETANNASLRFEQTVLERKLRFVRYQSWKTDGGSIADVEPDDERVIYRYNGDHTDFLIWEKDGLIGYVMKRGDGVSATVGANTEADVTAEMLRLKDLFPYDEPENDQVPIRFWTLSPNAARNHTRNLDAPSWSDVSQNYATNTKSLLEPLVGRHEAPVGGQLLLWHGPPGTGKTYALRALLKEWSKWCSADFIVDADAFFGGPASYLYDVLLSEADTPYRHRLGRPADDDEPDEEDERWRLLIFEDAGELLRLDAKERVGQGLSRFLNIVDGFIGQGLRIMIMVTTNEEIGQLHPAVSRPGRASSIIKFDHFSPEEAAAWLQAHGGNPDSRARSLAEMYAEVGGGRKAQEPRRVGFRMPDLQSVTELNQHLSRDTKRNIYDSIGREG